MDNGQPRKYRRIITHGVTVPMEGTSMCVTFLEMPSRCGYEIVLLTFSSTYKCCFLVHCMRKQAYVRALLVAQLPHDVLLAEAAEWMPDVDFQPLRDRGINERGIGQALPTLISRAANHLGSCKYLANRIAHGRY